MFNSTCGILVLALLLYLGGKCDFFILHKVVYLSSCWRWYDFDWISQSDL